MTGKKNETTNVGKKDELFNNRDIKAVNMMLNQDAYIIIF
jgi:hypothetical protein